MKKNIKKVMVLLSSMVLLLTSAITTSFADTSTYTVVDEGTVTYAATSVRDTALDRMVQMSNVPWTLKTNLSYAPKSDGNKILLKAGSYKGLPYTQVEREYSSCDSSVVQARIDKGEIKGTDCSSSIAFAWRYATGHNTSGDNYLKNDAGTSTYTTALMFKDAISTTGKNYVSRVGKYGSYASSVSTAANTDTIVERLMASGNYSTPGADIYDMVYANARPGDALITKNSSFNHMRMITKVEIVRNADNTVNEGKSKIYFIEQIGFNDEKRPGTSWQSKNLTFRYLATGVNDSGAQTSKYKYIPITLNDFE